VNNRDRDYRPNRRRSFDDDYEPLRRNFGFAPPGLGELGLSAERGARPVNNFFTPSRATCPRVNTTRHHPMSSLRTWAAWSVISPALAFLLVMAVEILIDLLTEVGAPAPLAVAAGAFGYFLFRKMSPRPKVAPLYAGDEDALDEQAMAAPSA
jgi:hypothetical protein